MPHAVRRRGRARSAVARAARRSSAALGAAAGRRGDRYVPITGAGSTWSQNALDQWRRNVDAVRHDGQLRGDRLVRRPQRLHATAPSTSRSREIPYGARRTAASPDTPPTRGFAYMPIVAGGTSFMYNLKIGGKQVTNLRLSGDVDHQDLHRRRSRTGTTRRSRPTTPASPCPTRTIVPVVRSDGSGYDRAVHPLDGQAVPGALERVLRARSGRATPCGITSQLPDVSGNGFIAQSGSLGVAGYVAPGRSSEGAITYVEYSYALKTGLPGRQGAQQGRLLHRADRRRTSRSRCSRRRSTPTPASPTTSPRSSTASTTTPTRAPTRCRATPT